MSDDGVKPTGGEAIIATGLSKWFGDGGDQSG